MLNALTGPDLRLGVNWYLNESEEANSDGTFVHYPDLRDLNPHLFDSLAAITNSGNRTVAALERAGVFPRNTIFFSDPLPARNMHFEQREAARRDWFRRAVDALRPADVVFVDPDTGLAGGERLQRTADAAKYAFLSEIEDHLQAGQSVIVYQHQTRRAGGVAAEIDHWLSRFTPRHPACFALVFRKFSVRMYFVIPSDTASEALLRRATEFTQGPWRSAFELARQQERVAAAVAACGPAGVSAQGSPASDTCETDAMKTQDTAPLRRHLDNMLRMEGAHISFAAAVAEFPVTLRGTKPPGAPHTAWELLEHMRIAQEDILDFSRNPGYRDKAFPDDYWPPSPEPPSEEAWDRSVRQFESDLEEMRELIADPAKDLFARIPHGSDQTLMREALLVADHNAYHLGQLVFLRRMLEG